MEVTESNINRRESEFAENVSLIYFPLIAFTMNRCKFSARLMNFVEGRVFLKAALWIFITFWNRKDVWKWCHIQSQIWIWDSTTASQTISFGSHRSLIASSNLSYSHFEEDFRLFQHFTIIKSWSLNLNTKWTLLEASMGTSDPLHNDYCFLMIFPWNAIPRNSKVHSNDSRCYTFFRVNRKMQITYFAQRCEVHDLT